MVKIAVLITTLSLALSQFLLGSVAVNVPPKASGRNVRITTLVEGKPRNGATVEICRHRNGEETGDCFSLTTDSNGEVVPRSLRPGVYTIVGSADSNLVGDLYLRVSSRSPKKISAFSIDLAPTQFPTWRQRLASAEKMTSAETLRQFGGVIHDQSGSEISNVSIEVVRKGTEGKDRVAQLKSGKDGIFQAQLPPGQYLAIFREPGFSIRIVPVRIAEEGGELMQVTLEIAPATQ